MENNGWIKLHRIIMDHPDWLSEPFTKAQAWVDLLLLANHKVGHIRKRGILIEVQRGQVGYSEETLAARWRWSREKVRRFLGRLRADGQISRNPVHQNPKLSCLISILNYELYQSDETTSETTEKHQTIQEQEEKEGKEKTLCDFSSEISILKDRYPDQKIIDQALEAIQSTRKTGRIAGTVILSILESWGKHSADSVMAGIRTYLEKGYATEGKREAYLLGIIRNNDNTGKPSLPHGGSNGPKVRPSTGDRVLDDHYRGQGWEIRT